MRVCLFVCAPTPSTPHVRRFAHSRAGKLHYSVFVEAQRLHLLDLLNLFPSCAPPLDRLLSALSPLHARLYSVASSPLVRASRVTFAFTVVSFDCVATTEVWCGVEVGVVGAHQFSCKEVTCVYARVCVCVLVGSQTRTCVCMWVRVWERGWRGCPGNLPTQRGCRCGGSHALFAVLSWPHAVGPRSPRPLQAFTTTVRRGGLCTNWLERKCLPFLSQVAVLSSSSHVPVFHKPTKDFILPGAIGAWPSVSRGVFVRRVLVFFCPSVRCMQGSPFFPVAVVWSACVGVFFACALPPTREYEGAALGFVMAARRTCRARSVCVVVLP